MNHWPASGARGSPALEPSESAEPQKPSYRPQALPSARCEVQPSLSPGVFSQKYASTKSGRAVSAVGHNPRPAPRMLHQLEQSCRMSSTPLRPVSITKWGSVTPDARSWFASICTSVAPNQLNYTRWHLSAHACNNELNYDVFCRLRRAHLHVVQLVVAVGRAFD